GIVRGARRGGERFVALAQAPSVGAKRMQGGAARERADIGSGAREASADQAAHGAHADDAHLHYACPAPLPFSPFRSMRGGIVRNDSSAWKKRSRFTPSGAVCGSPEIFTSSLSGFGSRA